MGMGKWLSLSVLSKDESFLTIFYILEYINPLPGNASFSQLLQYFVHFSLLIVLDILWLLIQICSPLFHFALSPGKLIFMNCIK